MAVKRRWWLLSSVLAAALVSLTVMMLLPRHYEARAMLLVKTRQGMVNANPVVLALLQKMFNLDPALEAQVNYPDTRSIQHLLRDPDLPTLFAPDEVRSQLPKPMCPEDLADRMWAQVRGTDQIWISIVDRDPYQAAKLTNAWSQIVAQWFNNNYGFDLPTLESVEERINESQLQIAQADQMLDQFNAHGRRERLELQQNEAIQTLRERLGKIRLNESLISDAKSLIRQIENRPDDQALPPGIIHAITVLHVRSAGGGGDSSPTLKEAGHLPAVMHAELEQLITALKIQQDEIQADRERLEEKIDQSANQMEVADKAHRQLTKRQDQVLRTYDRLTQYRDSIAVELAQGDDEVARVVVAAKPPQAPNRPGPLPYVAAAALIGLLIAWAVCLFLEP